MANKTAMPRFMLDRDQIFFSKAFRRLAGKTQLKPEKLHDDCVFAFLGACYDLGAGQRPGPV